jgi:hypothetical protein
LHGHGYCHNDIKSDNCAIVERGASYELVLMDYGKLIELNPHFQFHVRQHGSRGANIQLAPELSGDGKRLVDGRKTDMFSLGQLLARVVDAKTIGVPSRELRALFELLTDQEPAKRPLAADLLNDTFDATSLKTLTEDELRAYDWLKGMSATDSQLIDELESRRRSEDVKANRYTETFAVSELSVDEAIEAVLEALTAEAAPCRAMSSHLSEGRLESDEVEVTPKPQEPFGTAMVQAERTLTCKFAQNSGGDTDVIRARLLFTQRILYEGEQLKSALRKKGIGGELKPPILNLTSIPDMPLPDSSEFVRRAQNLLTGKDPLAWSEVKARKVAVVKFTYLAGTCSASFIAFRQLVKTALQNIEPVEVSCKTALIRAYALVKWVRLIVVSGYVFHEAAAAENLKVFNENLVPLFLAKLGQMLAANHVAAIREATRRKNGSFSQAFQSIKDVLTAQPGTKESMHLSADQIEQFR